eukprot:12401271-Karenia_brevis.AAC.1
MAKLRSETAIYAQTVDATSCKLVHLVDAASCELVLVLKSCSSVQQMVLGRRAPSLKWHVWCLHVSAQHAAVFLRATMLYIGKHVAVCFRDV